MCRGSSQNLFLHLPVAAMNEPADLNTFTLEDFTSFCTGLHIPRYRADQLVQWIHQKNAGSFDEMSNLPQALRTSLSSSAQLNALALVHRSESADKTVKCLFRLHDGKQVESVLIPEFFDDGVPDRLTVCVSSQVGCLFGCTFCATGKMGLHRNLSIGEITRQVLWMNQIALETVGKKITNVVYMGMGEPFHNYKPVTESAALLCHPLGLNLSPRRITISTVGLTRQIVRYADEAHPWNLAISLHAADDAKRNRIMPINENLNLQALKQAVRHYYEKSHQPLTYEYLLFDQFNDSIDDARKLASIARWAPSKVNIIMYNHVDGVDLQRASESRLDRFMAELTRSGARATVRRSRGDDIDAGCGQLAIREEQAQGKTLIPAQRL